MSCDGSAATPVPVAGCDVGAVGDVDAVWPAAYPWNGEFVGGINSPEPFHGVDAVYTKTIAEQTNVGLPCTDRDNTSRDEPEKIA